MCKMTDTGVRWKRAIELPGFGETTLWWAVRYGSETRYVRAPVPQNDPFARNWLNPLYAVRVRARTI